MVVIKDITDIPEVPVEIIKAAENAELTMFLGAGVSKLVDCPLWDELAHDALRALFLLGKFTYKEMVGLGQEVDPRRLLSICWDVISDDGDCQSKVCDLLNPQGDANKENIYDSLVSYKCPLITLNYDLCIDYAIERYIRKNNKSLQYQLPSPVPPITELTAVKELKKSYFREEDLTESNAIQGKVLHLHGSVTDFMGMVVTTKQYLDAYSTNENAMPVRRQTLDDLFKKRTLLFIGTRMGEFEILEYLSRAREVKHFMLFPAFKDSRDLVNRYRIYYEHLGITLVPYNLDNKGPSQLIDVISDWAPKISSVAEAIPVARGLDIIDDVEL